jgi:uncharacterized protein
VIVVVTDTSPLRALAVVHLLGVLPRLYNDILLPPAVAAELAVDVPGIGPLLVQNFEFLRVLAPTTPTLRYEMSASLGRGETEAITLALELHADFVLVDDGEARNVAARLGLTPAGTIGILVRAKDAGLIPQVAPIIDELVRRTRFRISDSVRRQILRLAGEA